MPLLQNAAFIFRARHFRLTTSQFATAPKRPSVEVRERGGLTTSQFVTAPKLKAGENRKVVSLTTTVSYTHLRPRLRRRRRLRRCPARRRSRGAGGRGARRRHRALEARGQTPPAAARRGRAAAFGRARRTARERRGAHHAQAEMCIRDRRNGPMDSLSTALAKASATSSLPKSKSDTEKSRSSEKRPSLPA